MTLQKLLKLFLLTGASTRLNPLGTVAPVGLFPFFKSKTEGGCS